MAISAEILQKAIHLYLQIAYPKGVPANVQDKSRPVEALQPTATVPAELLEADPSNSMAGRALRLGQPAYPFMKLMVEPAPSKDAAAAETYLLRVDAHDRHLHAAPGSPDAAWLTTVRASNQELVEKIETAWSQAGLPTFKDFLRKQLDARRAAKAREGA